jgi:hypothetical protein
MPEMSRDFVAQHFVNYMFDAESLRHARHVQRVASWIGMVLLAIEHRKDEWKFVNKRQLAFRVGDQWFKVRYQHEVRPRGGFQIVKMTDGRTDGQVVKELGSLDDVERFYLASLSMCSRTPVPEAA